MAVTSLVLVAALSGSEFFPGPVTYFFGRYFNTHGCESFQRYVMASWPGPTELMRMWRDGGLSEAALRNLDGMVRRWRSRNCQLDGEAILYQNLRSLGAKTADPLGPSSVRVWLAALEGGNSQWPALAARRLSASGGPWYEFSVLRPDTKDDELRKEELSQ